MVESEVITQSSFEEVKLPRLSKPIHKEVAFICLMSIVIVTIITCAILFVSMSSKINKQGAALLDNQNVIKELEQKLTTNEKQVDDLASRTKQLGMFSILAYLQHDIEGGIVTDDFYVNKITFNPDENKLNAVIDLANQPTMLGIYKGKGAFDLPDRELRAKSSAILDKVKEYYMKNKTEALPSWDGALINLTIQNYVIGTVNGGELKLVGEK